MISDAFVSMVLFTFTAFYIKNRTSEVETVISSYDNREYLVRSLPNKDKAAALLGKMNKRLQILVDHIQSADSKASEEDVNRLVKNFNPDSISEGTEKSNYTSYSVNKGEKIVFCLRSKENNEKLIDINTLMYVAIHELAHLMTKEIGHPPEFWRNFKILLREGINIGIYKNIDYSKEPVKYCGMKIKSNILIR
jgi:hypothetical protein